MLEREGDFGYCPDIRLCNVPVRLMYVANLPEAGRVAGKRGGGAFAIDLDSAEAEAQFEGVIASR